MLEALDNEARAWAQRQLDLGGEAPESDAGPLRSEPPESEQDVDSGDPEAVLAAAVRAQEEFDYEEAGRRYARALRLRRDVPSAQALLRFLVDAMAADAEALAIDRELPAAVRAHPSVAVLLGIAAARSGDEAAAMTHLAHVEEPRAAEALALTARLALARGDTEAAAARLAAAAKADPAHPDLRALEGELTKAREAQRAPLEADLGRLLAEGKDAEAERCAETILARWPESEAARRAARTLSARRQNEEGRQDRRRGGGRAEAGGPGLGAGALLPGHAGEARRAAIASGPGAPSPRSRPGSGSARRRSRWDRVAAALAARDDLEILRALGSYADLGEPLRARVRARTSLPALEWIDAMLRGGVRAAAAVEAAIALGRAAALCETDPAAALALHEGHEKALEGVAFARRLAAEARERAAAERQRRALADLAAAEEAVARGLADQAHELFERAAAILARTERARIEALRARLDDLDARRRIQRRFERARAGHQYTEAQRAAERPGPARRAREGALGRGRPDLPRRGGGASAASACTRTASGSRRAVATTSPPTRTWSTPSWTSGGAPSSSPRAAGRRSSSAPTTSRPAGSPEPSTSSRRTASTSPASSSRGQRAGAGREQRHPRGRPRRRGTPCAGRASAIRSTWRRASPTPSSPWSGAATCG